MKEISPCAYWYWVAVDDQFNWSFHVPTEDRPTLAPGVEDSAESYYNGGYLGDDKVQMFNAYGMPVSNEEKRVNGGFTNYVIPKAYKRIPRLFPVPIFDEYTPQPQIEFAEGIPYNDGAYFSTFFFSIDDCDTKHRPWHQLTIYWSYGPFDFNFTLDKSMTQSKITPANGVPTPSENYYPPNSGRASGLFEGGGWWGGWLVDTGITIPSPPEGYEGPGWTYHDISFHPVSSFEPPFPTPPTL